MRKYIILGAIVLVVTAFALFGVLLSSTALGLTASDKAFVKRLQASPLTPTGIVRLEDIQPSDWEKVCMVVPYDRASRIAASELGVQPESIRFVGSNDAVASDDLWGLNFIRKNNEVEYVQIHSSDYYSGDSTDCVDRSHAYLRIVEIRNNRGKRIQLFKN